MTEKTDPELVESFRNGDQRAFNTLVSRYQERVYLAARRILGTHEDADDLVQEVFLKVYDKLPGFRGDSEFYTWLYRITVNASLNAARKRRVVNFFRFDALHEPPAPAADAPDEILIRSEERNAFDQAVDRLPPAQKAVFVMRYREGLKFEAIAEALGRSVGGVKANFFHAIRKIDRFLKEAERG